MTRTAGVASVYSCPKQRATGDGATRAIPRSHRRLRLLALVGLTLLTTWLTPLTIAWAHAGLLDTEPANGQVFDAGTPPEAVTLTFSEPVSSPGNAIVVLNSSGVAIDSAPEMLSGSVVKQPLDAIAEDSYVVVYHVVSEDGHPVNGAYVFTYGDPSRSTQQSAAELAASSMNNTSRSRGRLLAVNGLENVLVLVAVGALAAWTLFTLRDRRTLLLASVLALAASLVSLTVALAEASVSGLAVMASLPAVVAIVRAALLAGLAACTWLARRLLSPTTSIPAVPTELIGRTRFGVVPVLLGMLTLATYTATGHGWTHGSVAVSVVLLWTHLAAASVWLGAAPVLAVALARKQTGNPPDERVDNLTKVMRRFSLVATVALPCVLAAGGVLAAIYTGLEPASEYALLLAVKLLLVAGLALLGLRARRALRVPAPIPVLRSTMRIEALAVVAVAALSAGLSTMSPTTVDAPVDHAGHVDSAQPVGTEILSLSCSVELNGRVVELGWDGALNGSGSVHVNAASGEGGPLKVLASHPLLAPSTLEYDLIQHGSTHWMGDVALPLAGEWTLTLEEHPDRFTVKTASCVIDLPADAS